MIPSDWPEPNVTYLNHLEFTSERIYRSIKRQCRIAKYFNSLNERAEWLGELYSNVIEKADRTHIQIQHINNKIGYGLFASKHLPVGSFIGVYTGVVRSRRAFMKNPNDYSFAYPQIKFSLHRYSINAASKGNETRYINHSNHPNCQAVSAFYDGILHIIIRTVRKVSTGEQLFYNYGDEYWRTRNSPVSIGQDVGQYPNTD